MQLNHNCPSVPESPKTMRILLLIDFISEVWQFTLGLYYQADVFLLWVHWKIGSYQWCKQVRMHETSVAHVGQGRWLEFRGLKITRNGPTDGRIDRRTHPNMELLVRDYKTEFNQIQLNWLPWVQFSPIGCLRTGGVSDFLKVIEKDVNLICIPLLSSLNQPQVPTQQAFLISSTSPPPPPPPSFTTPFVSNRHYIRQLSQHQNMALFSF